MKAGDARSRCQPAVVSCRQPAICFASCTQKKRLAGPREVTSHHTDRVNALDSRESTIQIRSKMDEDKLIVAVQRRSVIYDKEDRNYHNRDIISATWEGIATEVGADVAACRNKWGTLRDYFLKKYREAKTTKSGQAASKKKKWYLFDAMSFLIPYYCSRETQGNLNYEDQQLEDNVDSQNSQDIESQLSPAPPSSDDSLPQKTFKTPQQQRKRKGDCNTDFNMEVLKALKEPEPVDENELFFKSLLPSMKKLNDIQVMEFKIEVQSLLLKYLKQSSKPQNSAAEPSASRYMGAQHFGSELQDPRYTPISPRATYDDYYSMSSFNNQ